MELRPQMEDVVVATFDLKAALLASLLPRGRHINGKGVAFMYHFLLCLPRMGWQEFMPPLRISSGSFFID